MEERPLRPLGSIRKPWQGVANVVRFNWPLYLFPITLLLLLGLVKAYVPPSLNPLWWLAMATVSYTALASLAASYYVYDISDLYKLRWLKPYLPKPGRKILNINAGFDETSTLIENLAPACHLVAMDFYDAHQHTEPSIKRARRAYPPYPGTIQVNTNHLPIQHETVSLALALLSAHEVRDVAERQTLMRELARTITPDGYVIITEHLRDAFNFLAYNIGFLHFHSANTWHQSFEGSGLKLAKQIKVNPFITAFILVKDGATP